MKNTVVIGMSGGVDSAVSALLLKERGYKVIGVFVKNWDEDDCSAKEDYKDVVKTCEQLDIPYYTFNFKKQYQDLVFKNFIDGYKSGITPNPDILCNSQIKFNLFFKKAIQLGADYLSTGHYCRVLDMSGNKLLAKGVDEGKDQSYFLYAIDKSVLNKVIFPLGGILKSKVRDIANLNDLPVKDKKDSTGICFIGNRKFNNFISRYISNKEGNFVTPDGEVVGRHQGIHYYTIGQRKGLGLGGPGNPWFVVGKNLKNNDILVVRGEKHPLLYSNTLIADKLHFICDENLLTGNIKAKIRYRQLDQECKIEFIKEGSVKVIFNRPQRAISPGQSIVFYKSCNGVDICLGGGIISKNNSTIA